MLRRTELWQPSAIRPRRIGAPVAGFSVAHVVTANDHTVTAFYWTVALCNPIGVAVPIVAIGYIRKLSRATPGSRRTGPRVRGC